MGASGPPDRWGPAAQPTGAEGVTGRGATSMKRSSKDSSCPPTPHCWLAKRVAHCAALPLSSNRQQEAGSYNGEPSWQISSESQGCWCLLANQCGAGVVTIKILQKWCHAPEMAHNFSFTWTGLGRSLFITVCTHSFRTQIPLSYSAVTLSGLNRSYLREVLTLS